jgi:hypothetical protein
MSNVFDDFRAKLNEAKRIQMAADEKAGEIARLLVGRLRSPKIETRTLKALKKELSKFDLRSNDWSEPKWRD